ncbi:MAG: 4Fe-4S binding protein [Candidatus Micrarchaeia archaeon]
MPKKVQLIFPPEISKEPITSETILKTGTPFNLLRGEIGLAKSEIIGEIMGDEKRAREFISELKKRGVIVNEIESLIKHDKDKCVNCGYCISLCPTDALTMDKEVKLKVDFSKCVLCRMCVKNCPVQAFAYSNLYE